MALETRDKISLAPIHLDQENFEEKIKNYDLEESLTRLEQENSDLKILNAKLFKNAMNALGQINASKIS